MLKKLSLLYKDKTAELVIHLKKLILDSCSYLAVADQQHILFCSPK